MEIFESVIENVSSIDVKGYEDPVEGTHNLEIWVKSGEEEYIYKFAGPGVRNANLIAVAAKGKNRLLEIENEKLKKKIGELENELGKWKREAADCLRSRDKAQKENKQLKQENEESDNKILEYIASNDRLLAENEELKKKLNTPSIPTKMLDRIAELDKLNKDLADSVLKSEGLNDLLRKRVKALEELKTPTIENFADEEPSSRRDILKAAEKCVCGQREQDYGTPESNFQLIADLWNGYLGFLDHPGWQQIRATDVAMMMALMKIARIRNGGGSGDSFVDLAGYAACGGEIWYGGKKQVPEGE